MRALAWLLGSGCVALGLAAGCGSSTSGGEPGASIALENIPPLYAKAVCDAQEACVGAAASLLFGGEDCVATATTAITDELDTINAAIAAGRAFYDGTKTQACMDAIAARGCDTINDEPDECQLALDGTVESGGDCDATVECKGDLFCESSGTCPGKCRDRGVAGADCTDASECGPGTQCNPTTSKCFQPAAVGAACQGAAPECAPGLFCQGADEKAGTSGTCATVENTFVGKEGDECLFPDKPLCAIDLRCLITIDTATQSVKGTCSKPVAAGAACNVGFPDPCPTDQYCMAPDNQTEGTCTVRPGDGQTCGKLPFDTTGEICKPGTRCDGGTCVSRQHLGGSCGSDEVCFGGNCSGGKCISNGQCD